jgi:hypothetical protein
MGPAPPVQTDIGGLTVSHRKGRCAHVQATLYAVAVALVSCAVPASSAAAPPTPESTTSCGGFVAKDASPTPDDPNLIDYNFYCDSEITAYTVIADRRPSDFGNIDDFSPTAAVLDPTTGAPSATESITCEGTVPSNGINCNLGPGGQMTVWDRASGTFDLTAPYCKYIPKGAKPGTLATPSAFVELVVTDATGAQDGPFRLRLNSTCPTVPNSVPLPKRKPKPTTKPRKPKRITTKKVGHK